MNISNFSYVISEWLENSELDVVAGLRDEGLDDEEGRVALLHGVHGGHKVSTCRVVLNVKQTNNSLTRDTDVRDGDKGSL